MTLHELSAEFVALGCDSAINLDGGGSTTLVYRDPATHDLKIANSPSDTKERSVADALGFTYLDSGAMYRSVALAALQRGRPPAAPCVVELDRHQMP